MGSVVVVTAIGSEIVTGCGRRDSASALPFRVPLQCIILNAYYCKAKAHQQRSPSIFCADNHYNGAWLVITVNKHPNK